MITQERKAVYVATAVRSLRDEQRHAYASYSTCHRKIPRETRTLFTFRELVEWRREWKRGHTHIRFRGRERNRQGQGGEMRFQTYVKIAWYTAAFLWGLATGLLLALVMLIRALR